MPKPGKEDVSPRARALFLAILDEQVAKGRAKYGTSLQTHNGRNPFRDALAEQVDNIQYTVQAMMEYDDLLAEVGRLQAQLGQLAEAGTGYSQQTMDALVRERAGLQAEVERLRAENEELQEQCDQADSDWLKGCFGRGR